MNVQRLIFIGSLAFLCLVLAIGLLANRQDTRLNGSVLKPATPAEDFTLTDQNGRLYRLSDRQGKLIVLFFGYTHCPDFCPMTLAMFRDLKEALKENAGGVEFVFITVDPERDTVSRIKEYVDAFDPAIIGLTGSRTELEPVWKSYGVYQEKHAGEHGSQDTVDHSTRTYLIDGDGNLLLTYPFGFEIEKIIQDIQYLLKTSNG